jgi:hypothetical protein
MNKYGNQTDTRDKKQETRDKRKDTAAEHSPDPTLKPGCAQMLLKAADPAIRFQGLSKIVRSALHEPENGVRTVFASPHAKLPSESGNDAGNKMVLRGHLGKLLDCFLPYGGILLYV